VGLGKLVFGIYPGGVAGGDSGLLAGTPDSPELIQDRLDELQGWVRPFVVRCYDSFQDADSPFGPTSCAPQDYLQYFVEGKRPLELVLQFRSASGSVPGYLDFVREKIEGCYPSLYSVQITEEPNFVDGPNVIDGPYPKVREALVRGVVAAKETLRRLGRAEVRVGFNATPTFGPSAEFWSALRTIGDEKFLASLDFVGIDFFPDVFRRLNADGQPGDLRSSVIGVLETMRNVWLPAGGIPGGVAIDITEHGWPTGAERSAERQAEVLATVLRTIWELRERLNIARYMLFALRDVGGADAGSGKDIFRFFGITAEDYSRKRAFEVFRGLVRELGG
jgi:hypothetical protein